MTYHKNKPNQTKSYIFDIYAYVLHIPQSSSMTGNLTIRFLNVITRTLFLEGVLLSAEIQSVYSRAPPDWETSWLGVLPHSGDAVRIFYSPPTPADGVKRFCSYLCDLKFSYSNKKKRMEQNIHRHHHHHVVLVARISLTLSHHFSLSFIPSGRSSGQHPVSSHSCWMYVRTGRPAFARPCVGVHKSTSLMSSSLLLQQCPACLVRLTWIVFLCNCHLASSPAILLESM